jgi:hypothetical protein
LSKNKLISSKQDDNIISDYQLAQSFIIRTKDFSNSNTKCSLIVTSKAIYNNNAANFRKYFLEKFYLHGCFDLSPVRRLIFEGADNPAMILQFQSANGLNTLENIVYHKSLKYNIYLKYFKSIVIQKNDNKTIKQRFFYENQWMFKVALYGGVLDFVFLKKLMEGRSSIDSVLKDKFSIESGNGIHKGTPKHYYTELIGFPIIETENIQEYFTPVLVDTQRLVREDVYLERGRSIELFTGSKILFTRRPKKETFISVSLCNEDAVFRNSAYGIPLNNKKNVIYQLYSTLISNLFTYYQYLTTSNWGIYLPEINKVEYLSFPYADINNVERAAIISLVNSFLQPFKHHYSKFNFGEPIKDDLVLKKINDIIDKVYNIKTYEKDLIDYVLNISRYQFQSEDKQKIVTDFTFIDETHYRNRNLVLTQYASVFIDEFKGVYDDEYLQIEIYPFDYFIAMNFVFLKEKPSKKNKIILISENTNASEVLEKLANRLSISKITSSSDPSKNIYIQRDIKGFEQDSFYIIKPSEYKCWHRAMAWYDVAEIKESIEKAELNHLKDDFDVS